MSSSLISEPDVRCQNMHTATAIIKNPIVGFICNVKSNEFCKSCTIGEFYKKQRMLKEVEKIVRRGEYCMKWQGRESC